MAHAMWRDMAGSLLHGLECVYLSLRPHRALAGIRFPSRRPTLRRSGWAAPDHGRRFWVVLWNPQWVGPAHSSNYCPAAATCLSRMVRDPGSAEAG